MPIDTVIVINGRQIRCRGTHVYRGPEEEGDMLDPGLVMTGTKCGHNHVSSFLQPHSASGLQKAVVEVGVWLEDAWVQIPASPTSLALWLAFFIEHIIKSKTHRIELLYGLNEIIPVNHLEGLAIISLLSSSLIVT